MRTLFLAVLWLPLVLFGQSDTLSAKYQRKAIYSASGSFTDLDNWNAGGENSSNISFLIRENWMKKGPSFTTVHLLEGNYGLSRQAGTLTKNADRLEFTTTLTGSPKVTEWNLSSQFNVKTQLAPGYAKGDTLRIPISNFGAPIYGQFSFGLGNNSWENWQLFLSPMAGKSTTVLNQDLRDKAAFGVETGATWRLEAGAKITLNYTEQFSDAFSINAKTDIFYNYWGPISATDFMFDVIALYKIKEAFSINAHLQLIRDIDQIDAWQRRSVIGVGLAYTIK
ncbi:DUF3078 domain-containing protein [Schleiferiaceae bacterium]|nr:DUF3078 domain-containing protein [Schleiferiaceae bacterium]MDC0377027.1 DUF3078 domain-containing protein [Schleiferiaceae bacterium]